MLNRLHWINKRLPALATILLYALWAFAGFPSPTHADVYKWKDDSDALHFTDDPALIPERFRKNTKILKSGKEPVVPADPPSHRKPPPRESEFVIPLHPQGNQFFIDTRLNGQTQAKLLLDTGATTVVLSEKLAQKLGFNYFHTMPQVKAETAGGTIWAPLLSLRKVRAGVAVVEEVEAIISPKLIKVDGLMGMTFLSQFKMKLDHASAVLTLKPLMDPPLYDGKPKAWWKQKFSDYRSKIRHFKRLAEDLKKKGDAKAFNVEKTVLHYEALYTQLKARGNKSGIPSDLKPGK